MKRKEEKETEGGRGDKYSGSHLDSFLLSSDRWEQQLPVLLITAAHRLTGIEMKEEVGGRSETGAGEQRGREKAFKNWRKKEQREKDKSGDMTGDSFSV